MQLISSLSLFLFLCLLFQNAFSQAPGIEWEKCLGSIYEERGYSMDHTYDGGFIVAGSADYDQGDVSGTIGGGDWRIVKLDSMGNFQWQKCLGGSGLDRVYAVRQTTDKGYIAAGFTESTTEM